MCRYRGYLIKIIALLLVVTCGCSKGTSRNHTYFKGACRVGYNSDRHSPIEELTIEDVLENANKDFSYQNKPIHPALVKEFSPLLSDLHPVSIMVDVAAAFDSNEYCQAVTENTKLGIQCEITNNENGTEEKEFFAYKYLGKIAGNIHILETSDYGSGTGIFMSLMLVKFNTDKGFYDDGTPYDQLMMRLVRSINLGDRFNGNIQITSNSVIIESPTGKITIFPDSN